MGQVYIGTKDKRIYVFDQITEMPNRSEGVFDKWKTYDELILPSIIELNQKGYITDGCCCGHYYPHSVMTEERPEDSNIYYIEEESEDGVQEYYSSSPGDMSGAYISFKNAYSFPSLPDGWKQNGGVHISVDYSYSSEDPFSFYLEQVKEMKKLYEWCKALPLYSDTQDWVKNL